MEHANIRMAQRLLYYTYSIIPVVAGLDKFFNLLTDWPLYLSSSIPFYLNLSPETCMRIVGAIEVFAGVLVFVNPLVGGYLVSGWLIAVSINLISMGTHYPQGSLVAVKYYDIAVRDLVMAVGAYVLALLSGLDSKGSVRRK